jgi:hypothetical protein
VKSFSEIQDGGLSEKSVVWNLEDLKRPGEFGQPNKINRKELHEPWS